MYHVLGNNEERRNQEYGTVMLCTQAYKHQLLQFRLEYCIYAQIEATAILQVIKGGYNII